MCCWPSGAVRRSCCKPPARAMRGDPYLLGISRAPTGAVPVTILGLEGGRSPVIRGIQRALVGFALSPAAERRAAGARGLRWRRG